VNPSPSKERGRYFIKRGFAPLEHPFKLYTWRVKDSI
jgi:hypothetical protein